MGAPGQLASSDAQNACTVMLLTLSADFFTRGTNYLPYHSSITNASAVSLVLALAVGLVSN